MTCRPPPGTEPESFHILHRDGHVVLAMWDRDFWITYRPGVVLKAPHLWSAGFLDRAGWRYAGPAPELPDIRAPQATAPAATTMQLSDNGHPRRNRMDLWTAGEKAIAEAHHIVECLGAHPLLTEAGVLLMQAQGKVADWVELPSVPQTAAEIARAENERADQQDEKGEHGIANAIREAALRRIAEMEDPT